MGKLSFLSLQFTYKFVMGVKFKITEVTQSLMTALFTESLVTQTWSSIPVNNKLMNGFWHPGRSKNLTGLQFA